MMGQPSDTSGYTGYQTPTSAGSPQNIDRLATQGALDEHRTTMLVQIKALYGGGEGAAPTADVDPTAQGDSGLRAPWPGRRDGTMPRFYFDIHDSCGFHRNEFGEDLPDMDEARHQGQWLLPELARDELPDGELHTIACDVRDEADRVIYRGEITCRVTLDPV